MCLNALSFLILYSGIPQTSHKYISVSMSIFNFCILMFSLCAQSSMGFDKLIVSCIKHYKIIQKSFTAFTIPCAPPVHSPKSKPMGTPDMLKVGIVFLSLFPFLMIHEIMQFVAFLLVYITQQYAYKFDQDFA